MSNSNNVNYEIREWAEMLYDFSDGKKSEKEYAKQLKAAYAEGGEKEAYRLFRHIRDELTDAA